MRYFDTIILNTHIYTKSIMTRTLLLALLAAVSVCLSAQKNVNIDSYRFYLTYRGIPTKPQTPKFFYYGKEINITGETQEAVNMDDLYEALGIEGQRYVTDDKDADFIISVEIPSVSFSAPEVKDRVEETKDKEGRVTSRNYYYSIVVTYTLTSRVIFKQGNNVISRHFAYNSPASGSKYQTKEYSSLKEANNNWKVQRDDVFEKIRHDLAFESARNARNIISGLYGFPVKRSSEMIKTINEKKHPENEALRAMADQLKAKLESMSSDQVLTEDDVAEELQYFKELPTRYTDPKLKADVKLRYVGYYNVAKIYLYLDMPDKVAEYANLLFENGHDKGDAKKLNEDADKLKALFDSSEIKARHFSTDPYFIE